LGINTGFLLYLFRIPSFIDNIRLNYWMFE
jgi:hypothetical protein